jgi:hypothetical protein
LFDIEHSLYFTAHVGVLSNMATDLFYKQDLALQEGIPAEAVKVNKIVSDMIIM